VHRTSQRADARRERSLIGWPTIACERPSRSLFRDPSERQSRAPRRQRSNHLLPRFVVDRPSAGPPPTTGRASRESALSSTSWSHSSPSARGFASLWRVQRCRRRRHRCRWCGRAAPPRARPRPAHPRRRRVTGQSRLLTAESRADDRTAGGQATTRAWGAAAFIWVVSHARCLAVSASHSATTRSSAWSRAAFAAWPMTVQLMLQLEARRYRS